MERTHAIVTKAVNKVNFEQPQLHFRLRACPQEARVKRPQFVSQ